MSMFAQVTAENVGVFLRHSVVLLCAARRWD